ncbi:MAG: RloB domain-containing protein [Candidatus Hydrogenedens sp.]|jgi:hypothetical protein|nr:RloB domain-containing protein [Candidatus Hydrogenedens sp.]
MGRRRRSFTRPYGLRSYKKLFVIATEGKKTEPAYFLLFEGDNRIVRIKCIKGDAKSAPAYVLKRMQNYLQEEALQKSDEAWIVVDQDQWEARQLQMLFDWAKQKSNRHVALSKPNFEYWLLLHFEDGTGLVFASDCAVRLKRYLPGYDKSIDRNKFPEEAIREAINRAKSRKKSGAQAFTDVYRLVENILKAQE